jgi:riboflavin synthase
MFTGIVEEVGIVEHVLERQGALRLAVAAHEVLQELAVDDSISVSGVCLTVVQISKSNFQVDVVEESLKKTTLGNLLKGKKVNLERSLRLSDRLGGHFVQGHVDDVGKVVAIQPQEGGSLISIEIPEHLTRYVISEGSIAIDGVSLTVARLSDNVATISIIPHTLNKTTFGQLKVGDKVNIEVDLIGKYVERLLSQPEHNKMTNERLQKMGY